MDNNKVTFDLDEVIAGMEMVHDPVAMSMGAAGKNVIYRQYGYPKSTNDGVSIANEISPEKESERLGADLIKQVAQRTVDEVGDGTSTSIVLSLAMVKQGRKKINAGVNPMRLRKEINTSAKKVVESLKTSALSVTTDEELFNIANISVEDPEVATLVRDAAKKAGLDGSVIVEESSGISIEKEEINGFKFENGYISPYMVTSPENMECVFEDVPILITDKKLQMNSDMFGLLEEVVQKGNHRLLVIAEDVSGELLGTIIANRLNPKGAIHVTVVKKPYFQDVLEDIAILTGGETLTETKGVKELKAEHYTSLGRAQRVVVTKDSCLIIGGKNDPAKLEERLASIRNELKDSEGYEEKKLKDRLAHLTGSVVIIKVGAPTRADMKYLKDKIDDAVHATRAAMEEGIVIGAGRALYDISQIPYENDGDEVVKRACEEPMRRILQNAGENADSRIAKLSPGEVFNVMTGEISKEPLKEGIIDPVKVERCAIANAASFAGLFLTSGAAIVDIPKPKDTEHSTMV